MHGAVQTRVIEHAEAPDAAVAAAGAEIDRISGSELREQRLEAIPGLDRALHHAGGECTLEGLGRAEVARRADLGPAVDLRECVRLRTARLATGDLEHEGPFPRAGLVDREELAEEDDILAIGRGVDIAPLAARP